jgi:hypothetical protein
MSRGLKYTFLVDAIVSSLVGIGMLFFPEQFRDMINYPLKDAMLGRGIGVALLALGVSSFLAFRANEWQQVWIVVRMKNAFTVLAFLTNLYGVLFAAAPSAAWGDVVIFGVFAILFGYFGSGPVAKTIPAPRAAR